MKIPDWVMLAYTPQKYTYQKRHPIILPSKRCWEALLGRRLERKNTSKGVLGQFRKF
jgi:hypothetical protein